LREDCGLRLFENRVLRGTFGAKRDNETGVVEKNYIMRSLMICTDHPVLFGLLDREE